jgi:predicted metallopeptidase
VYFALQGGPRADSKRRRAHSMPHKFKIGTIVDYYPKDRMRNTARGTYTVSGLMPETQGHQPEYRIKHFSEEFERVAFENELSAE